MALKVIDQSLSCHQKGRRWIREAVKVPLFKHFLSFSRLVVINIK
jgi:hypothetical protein